MEKNQKSISFETGKTNLARKRVFKFPSDKTKIRVPNSGDQSLYPSIAKPQTVRGGPSLMSEEHQYLSIHKIIS